MTRYAPRFAAPSTRAELVAAVKRLTGLDCQIDVGVYGPQVIEKAETRYNVSLTLWGRGPTMETAITDVWGHIEKAWETQTAMTLFNVDSEG